MDDQNTNDQSLPGSDAPQSPVPPTQPVQPPAPSVPQPVSPEVYGQPAQPYGQPAAPYGQPQVPGAQPSSYYQPAPQSNGKAVGALACGILAILFSWLPLLGVILGIVAIVLAVQAVKQAGKDGKATGGKVCGIIGIVLSVLAFFAWMALSLGLMAYMAAESYDSTYPGSSAAAPLSSDPSSSATEEEQQIEAAASAQLDKLKEKDAAIVQQLAADADEALESATDYRLTDLGIDPTLFVEWMLTDFEYRIDSASSFGSGTGVVDVNLTLRDSMVFATTFMADVQAAIDAGQMDGLDEAGAQALLGELYRAAMDKSTAMTSDYITLNMVKEGTTWQVDEDSWDSELEYLFGL